MRLADFDFELPPERIAQAPLPERDQSRLMRVNRATGSWEHGRFPDLIDRLSPNDLLVLNDTRVLPARLTGRRPTGGHAELLLLAEQGGDRWEALVRPGRKLPVGAEVAFGDPVRLVARIVEILPEGHRLVQLVATRGTMQEAIAELGTLPLPPYITAALSDPERYQTVYASAPGAVAAPTAGLHFTPRLLARLAERGIRQARVTLHTGLGTFRPVQAEDVVSHPMHAEWFELPEATAEAIRQARLAGGRIVAVGTTVTRTLEHCATLDGTVTAQSGETGLFIYPGYRFRVVDALVTNFHLPKSSLLMLVSAFLDEPAPGEGIARLHRVYREAIEQAYRFYSFGDAMLIV